jgi:hypothetical protein
LAKGLTFFPFGSVAFKVNIFSAFSACLTIVLLYLASVRFLQILFGPGKDNKFLYASLIPAGYLAFCRPFWDNAIQAEVYSLHTLFTCIIFWLLFSWRIEKDVRYLYGAALAFGLSAGNHATVAFYLPAILILFFCWNRENVVRNLSLSVCFFLIGLSVYTYLPIRSFAEPSFDWGNPETLKGFLYQVTDRKDESDHFYQLLQFIPPRPEGSKTLSAFAAIWETINIFIFQARVIIVNIFSDLQNNLSPLAGIGFVVGGVICLRKSIPLFLFLLVVAGFNLSFFYHWRAESYFPSYIVVSFFMAVTIYSIHEYVNHKVEKLKQRGSSLPIDFRKIIIVFLILLIPWSATINFNKVNSSGNYIAESLYQKIYLTIEDRAIFIPGISWFHYYFYQDISRLRDDVTAINVWDLLSPDPPSMLTARRFPNLKLPDSEKYEFNSKENISYYVRDLLEANATERPVLLEQCWTFYEQTFLIDKFIPFRNVLLKYEPKQLLDTKQFIDRPVFDEYKLFLEEEIERMNSNRMTADKKWISAPSFMLTSFAMYFHDSGQYQREREVLEIIFNFLGQKYDASWNLKKLDNLILDSDLQGAEQVLIYLEQNFSGQYFTLIGHGLMQKAKGKIKASLESFRKASELRPMEFRPHLEMATLYWSIADAHKAEIELSEAKKRMINLRQLKMVQNAVAS